MPGIQDLSERELEILRLVATGASNKEIAQQCYISANTVKVHLRNIFNKIGVNTRTEAAIFAMQAGLVARPLETLAEDQPGLPGVPSVVEKTEQLVPQRRRSPFVGWISIGVLFLAIALAVYGYIAQQKKAQALVDVPSPAESSRWQPRENLPTPRHSLALVSFENKIYAIGGETGQGVSDLVEQYDPETNTWVELMPKPTAVSEISAVVIGGKIYVPGGKLATGEISNRLEIYDLHSNTWIEGQAMPEALCGYALVTYEGKFYLLGGWDGKSAVQSVYAFDPSSGNWARKSPMPTARAYTGAGISSGQIFVFGGYDGQTSLNTNEVYTPDQDYPGGKPWQKSTPLPEGRYQMGVASFVDFILVMGGINEKNEAMLSLEFFVTNHTWQKIGSLGNKTWSRLGVVSMGSQLFVVGGLLDGQLTDQNLSYQAIYTMNMPIVR